MSVILSDKDILDGLEELSHELGAIVISVMPGLDGDRRSLDISIRKGTDLDHDSLRHLLTKIVLSHKIHEFHKKERN